MTEKQVPDRVTIVEHVYHQQFNAQPSSVESRFSRELQTHNQLYQRQLVATEKWKPLDCGWLDDVSFLVIVNNEGQFSQVNPTPEEREEASRHVLEVASSLEDETPWLVHPGESMRACPSNAHSVYVRCQHDTAQYTLYLFPL